MTADRTRLVTALLLGGALAWFSDRALAVDPQLEAAEEQAFKQAAALAGPSIVRIRTVGGLDRVGQVLTGTGATTGVVVSADGYVISNAAFNFASKPASILVELADGRRLSAELIATDRSKMLTLIKVEARDLAPAEAANPDEVKVGQWALALGRTFEDPLPSISVGVVSALGRVWGKAIQTDAKVSPVNYGGPLVNVEGRTMGILVPLSMQGSGETAGVEWYDSGIGFAIPLSDIHASLERLKKGEDLKPGLLGVELRGRGVLAGEPIIDRVRADSPADRAGFKAGDVIVEVEGKKVHRQADVRQVLGNKYAGDKLRIVVSRGDESIPGDVELVAELVAYESGFLGILPIREPIGGSGQAGVGVRHVYADSPAAKAGLAARDRILKFNDQETTDAAGLLDLVGRVRPGNKATLVVLQGDVQKTIEVELAAIPTSVPAELQPTVIPPPKEPAADPAAAPPAEGEKKDEPQGPKTGRFTETSEPHSHDFWAYVPEDYNPEYRYGLMVWLQPRGDTMEAALFKQWKFLCLQRGIIIVGPKAAKPTGWTDDEGQFASDLVDLMSKRYSIDPQRVFLHGFGDGGEFAFKLAFKDRDRFHGLAVVGAPLKSKLEENHPEHRLQIHLVSGTKDKLHPQIVQTQGVLRKAMFPVSLTSMDGRTHEYPPDEEVEEIARWADGLDRI